MKSKIGQTNQSPWPLPHPLLPLRVFQIVSLATTLALLIATRCEGEAIKTHDSGLELWWLAVENIRGFDSVFGNSDGAIKESH